jgi:hypothetical protein
LDESARAGAPQMLIESLKARVADYIARHHSDSDEQGQALMKCATSIVETQTHCPVHKRTVVQNDFLLLEAAMNSSTMTPKKNSVKATVRNLRTAFAPDGTIAFSVVHNVSHFEFLTVTGLSIPNDPQCVLATVRAPGNDSPGFSDSFALTVNAVGPDNIIFKIWRVDSSDDPSAPIQIDCLVVL